MTPIAVIGAGSWGTALAIVAARNESPTRMWGRNPDHCRQMSTQRQNQRYLPGIALPENVRITPDLETCLDGVEDLLIAVPSHAFVDILERILSLTDSGIRIAWATKGLHPEQGTTLFDHVRTRFSTTTPLAILSGPTFATEVAAGLPTAIALACEDERFAYELGGRLQQPNFRVYSSSDMIGASIAGAVKNVLAIAAGIADGLGFGANTQAALITRGLAEMTRLSIAAGGQAQTMMGLAGLGDLILTCTDNQSRNRRMGLGLAGGHSVDEIRHRMGQVVEGVRTAQQVQWLAAQLNVDMPISRQVFRVLYEGIPPQRAVDELLSRAPGSE